VADARSTAPAVGATTPGHYGVAGAQVALGTRRIAYAWNAQGDPRDAKFNAATQITLGLTLPTRPNTMTHDVSRTALWLGPRSWLILAYAEGVPTSAGYQVARGAINAAGGALFDVSASRIAFTLHGPRAADVLAKSCPLDFHPRVFAPGQCAQSLLGHVNVLIAKVDGTPTFTVLVARSLAPDAWRSLCLNAAPLGYDVS
jgi:sarcosine oxidase subunit gamma